MDIEQNRQLAKESIKCVNLAKIYFVIYPVSDLKLLYLHNQWIIYLINCHIESAKTHSFDCIRDVDWACMTIRSSFILVVSKVDSLITYYVCFVTIE